MKHEDPRNLIDKFKGKPVDDIVSQLDAEAHDLEIAIENLERDFNMGTIVRSANAFGVRTVHVIGRRQWNKRGAMATDKYLHVVYHSDISSFVQMMKQAGKHIYVIDNVEGSRNLYESKLPKLSVLVFGSESSGVSNELLAAADAIVAIEQFGSTRSLNVGVAAGIVMYRWLEQHRLTK